MKSSSKLLTAVFVASMMCGFTGCSGEKVASPVEVGQVDRLSNGAEISVKEFIVTKPDFLDAEGRYARPSEGQEEVAILKVLVKNTSASDITYKPLHFEKGKNRIQLCTDPDLDHPETRTNFKAIDFGSVHYHTPGQHIDQRVTIPAGHEIVDEYLFEVPVVNNERLVALIPGVIVGDAQRSLRYYLGPIKDVQPTPPASIRQGVSLEGLEVKVTQVSHEYAELSPRVPPSKPLKYAYAYTDKPVMAVYISITNSSREPRSYDPGHSGDGAGVNMLFSNGPLDRAKIKPGAYGKDQVSGKISINPGQTVKDVYYFVAPDSNGKLDFSLSGHLFSVKGIYRFKLDFTPGNPAAPDLKPYLNANKDGADAGNPGSDAAAGAEEEEEEESEE